MLTNFDKTTASGRKNLHNALGDQAICNGSGDAVVDRLVDLVVLEEHKSGDVIIEQGHPSNDVYLIVAGVAEVAIDKRPIGHRKAGDHVGEMAAVEPAAPRCATVSAQQTTVTARISAHDMLSLADEHPRIWHNLTKVLAMRLRERPVRARNVQPLVFLGGSSEGLAVTHQFGRLFAFEPFVTRPWTVGVFRPSGVPMDDLLRQAEASDFAVLSFGADDSTTSRDKQSAAPRDNVVLEYGLFAGALGSRERVFVIVPRGVDLKIPSDIQGLNLIKYDPNKPLDVALAPLASEIIEAVSRLGPR